MIWIHKSHCFIGKWLNTIEMNIQNDNQNNETIYTAIISVRCHKMAFIKF